MLNTKMIGNKIAEARKRINLSQAQLAQRMFISPQAVGKWERGESVPDIITFNRLAEILGVDLNYFSENFQSAAAETTSAGSVEMQPAELPSGKQKDSLSWDMSRGNWVDADFSGLKNLHEKFSSSNMLRCKFIGSDISGLLLKGNNVDSCDFSGSDISNSRIQGSNVMNSSFKNCSLNNSHLQRSNLSDNQFMGSSLKGAEFSESYASGCDFSGADFTGAVIKSGGLEKNTVTNAVWNRTSFVNLHLVDIVFEGAIEDCYFENCAFTRVTFQNAILHNTFFKNNRKLKKVRFIDCHADRITYEFLKSGRAEMSGITLSATEGGND